MTVVQLQSLEGFTGLVLLHDFFRSLALKIARPVFIVRVLQHTVDKQTVIEIIGVCLAEQSAVQIKYGNAAVLGNIVRAVLPRDGVHIGDQLLLQGRVLRPE